MREFKSQELAVTNNRPRAAILTNANGKNKIWHDGSDEEANWKAEMDDGRSVECEVAAQRFSMFSFPIKHTLCKGIAWLAGSRAHRASAARPDRWNKLYLFTFASEIYFYFFWCGWFGQEPTPNAST